VASQLGNEVKRGGEGAGTNQDSVEDQIHPPVKGEDRLESGRSLEHGIRSGGLESESESGRSSGDGVD